MPGDLYVVATPIGNLTDLSERARDVLREAEVVFAEDTRRTRVLLRHVGSRAPLVSLHAHNEQARLDELRQRLEAGQRCALVSDAGVPGVSDPGGRAVRAAWAAGARVVPVPGPSAVMAALAAAGLPADRFAFLGFPPRRGGARREWMAAAAGLPMTLVVFESPRRLVPLLEELADAGAAARRAAVCRELTKLHEEVRHGTVASLAEYYRGSEPRGEVTLVLEGRPAGQETASAGAAGGEVERTAREMAARGHSTKEIARALMEAHGLARNVAYELSLRAGREAR